MISRGRDFSRKDTSAGRPERPGWIRERGGPQKPLAARSPGLPKHAGMEFSEVTTSVGFCARDVKLCRDSESYQDYAELLFCKAFGWKREENAANGYDAIDEQGTRFLIKARRITRTGPSGQSRQLSAIRNLDNLPFDFLAGLLVDENFQVVRAVLVPVAVVWQLATYVAYTNSWRFLLRDSVWTLPGVRDVTSEVRPLHAAF